MYKKAETTFDHNCFRDVFLETTRAFHYQYNEPTGRETRYLFLKDGVDPAHYEKEDVIGTAEINPFYPHSIVQPYTETNLAEHPEIKPYLFDTYEIGKLCIKEEYRKMGYLTRLFMLVYEHQRSVGAKQYIGQLILPLYHTLTRTMQLKIHVLGEPDNDKVAGIPVLLRTEEALASPQLRKLFGSESGVLY